MGTRDSAELVSWRACQVRPAAPWRPFALRWSMGWPPPRANRRRLRFGLLLSSAIALLASVSCAKELCGTPSECVALAADLRTSCDKTGGSPCLDLAQMEYAGEANGKAIDGGAFLHRFLNGLGADRRKAFDTESQRCRKGSARGCFNVASMYEWGAVTIDGGNHARLAIEFYQKACDQNLALACFRLGNMTAQARQALWARGAADALEKACKGRVGWGCLYLAQMDMYLGSSPKDAQVVGLYAKACEYGVLDGCKGPGKTDDAPSGASAAGHASPGDLENACAKQDRTACYNVALAYFRGDGVSVDRAKAAEYFGVACAGAPSAQFMCENTARMFIAGESGPKDPALGRLILRKTCDGGWSPACNELRKLSK